jgi:putative ABC transport system permease protein
MSNAGPGVGIGRLTLYNLLRKPGRSAGAVLAVVLAAATAFAGGLIASGVSRALEVGLSRLGADLMVVPKGSAEATHTALVVGEPVHFYMGAGLMQQVAAVPGVSQVSPQLYVETLASSACCTGRVFMVGFDPATDFTVKPWLLRDLGRDLGPEEIVVGNHVYVLPGDTMKFYGTDFMVADRLDTSGMGMDETVFLPISTIHAMAEGSKTKAESTLTIPPNSVSNLMVRLENPALAEETAQAIEAALPEVTAIVSGDVTRGVSRDLSGLMTWMLPVATGSVLVAVLLFLVLFSAVARERAREIGLLRAVGATVQQAVAVLAGEALLLGLLGGALGVGAGLALYAIFQKAILFSYVLPFLWPGPLQTAALATAVVGGSGLLAAGAALWPALRIARLEPHFAIHTAGR